MLEVSLILIVGFLHIWVDTEVDKRLKWVMTIPLADSKPQHSGSIACGMHGTIERYYSTVFLYTHKSLSFFNKRGYRFDGPGCPSPTRRYDLAPCINDEPAQRSPSPAAVIKVSLWCVWLHPSCIDRYLLIMCMITSIMQRVILSDPRECFFDRVAP